MVRGAWMLLVVVLCAIPIVARGNSKDCTQLAQKIVTTADARLSADVGDERGLMLLRFAEALAPKDEKVLVTRALVSRKMKPNKPADSLSEDALVKELIQQAEDFRKTAVKTNGAYGPAAIALLDMALALQPGNLAALTEKKRLEAYGFTFNKEALDEGGYRFQEALAQEIPPPEVPELRLDKEDRRIARGALLWAADKLVHNPAHEKGLVAFRMAANLDPFDDNVLRIFACLAANIPVPKPNPSFPEKIISY